MGQHSVYIVEDNEATRRRLTATIERDPRLTLAGESGAIASAMEFVSSDVRADAWLVDLGLPDGNGVDLIRSIADADSEAGILVITVFGDEKHVVPAIEAGATGYLLKDRDDSHIADSICEVLAGGSPISPSIARLLLNRFRKPKETESPKPALLTAREEEVLVMVVKGFSYQEIADSMSLSVHTITSHIQHIYRKLSVRSRGEAVFEAIQLGLVNVSN